MYSKRNNNQINPELTFFSELEELLPSKIIKNVGPHQLNLLKYFIEHPNTILQHIKNQQNLKKEQIDNKYKSLKILLEKKLLDESYDIIRKRKIYKVSNIGIFYLILEGKTFSTETQKKLLINYNYCVIFRLFLYPYISCDSISKIVDSSVFSNIFVYLKKCCERVKDTLYYIEHPSSTSCNGYLVNQLFVWNKTSIENINYNSLRFFLKYYLALAWVEKAEIKKDSQDENILIISYRPDTAIIRLLDDKSKAILTIKGKKIYEFIVRELKGIDDYSIEAFVYIMNITIIVVLL